MKTVYVKDFVTLPCEDAAPGLRAALDAVRKSGAEELRFEKGTYRLLTYVSFDTDQTAHDAGALLQPHKDVHLPVEGFENLTLTGETDENGDPATVLAGVNPGRLHELLPSILWVEHCSGLTVRDLAFTREPEFASAGVVETIGNGRITVRVFEGNPCHDGMGTHCMNRFTPDGHLNGESLSYGPGLGNTFRLIGENLLELDDEKTASRVEKGDILTWHQGAKTDFQCFFGSSKDLTLDNVRVYNTNGFAMLAYDVHDLTARRVVFKPRGNQYFTGPRDAWKLHKCSGRIEIDRMYVEGVRMDGQNVHSNYLFVLKKLSDTELLLTSENAKDVFHTAEKAGGEGDIEFFNDEKKAGVAVLKAWEHVRTELDGVKCRQIYRFEFAEPLNFEVSEKTMALAVCFRPEEYYCHDSQYVNIAGAGHLLRIPHVRIENCLYRDTMNAGIMLGAEFPTFYEGGHCYDASIRNCTFDHCGFFPRYGTAGCVGIKSYGFETDVNHDIEIIGCTFKNAGIGVDIHNARDVRISDCRTENVDEYIRYNR